jgi:protein-ribulosamine 3-kinase
MQGIKRAIAKQLDRTITGGRSVSGGSINQAALLETDAETLFVKWNRQAVAEDMFRKEQRGLELLREATSELWIPKPLMQGQAEGVSFLVLTAFPSNSITHASNLDAKFGAALARMHQTHAEQFGLDHDNYIGRLPQSNTRHYDWSTFFAEERIRPMLRQAIDQGKMTGSTMQAAERFFKEMPNLFPEAQPSLLHGDLWGGNYTHLSDQTALYDPAVYYGHPEMELAFTYLFGGFNRGFYEGYASVSPLAPGFEDRRSFYNVYHLLTHTVMFGGHYAQQAASIFNQF